MKRITDSERKADTRKFRAAGETAFKRGEPITALSPLVAAWRKAAWVAGWKAAKALAKVSA